jgi:hypothetical protein
MATKKLVVNRDAKPNSSDSYTSGPVVVESKKGTRIAYAIQMVLDYDLNGDVSRQVAISTGDRVIYYELDDNSIVEFDDKSGTGTFTSYGNQYKIRALQDSDKSWVINFKLPEESDK